MNLDECFKLARLNINKRNDQDALDAKPIGSVHEEAKSYTTEYNQARMKASGYKFDIDERGNFVNLRPS